MHGSKRVCLAQVVVREQAVYQRLCPEWQSVYEQVDARLRQVMWARSLVECVNNVVRMPQAQHRHVRRACSPSNGCLRIVVLFAMGSVKGLVRMRYLD